MKPPSYLFLLALLFLPSLACRATTQDLTQGSGNLTTQVIGVRNFNSVSLDGDGKVYIEQGSTEQLIIEADDNILPLLDTHLKGEQLVLGVKPFQNIHPSQPIIYRLKVRDLTELAIRGSGDFYVDSLDTKDLKLSILGSGTINISNLVGKNLDLNLLGSGNITLEAINVKNIEASISGSGDILLQGEAKNQEISISGSGNYLAGDLETSLSEIKIPGSGDLTVWVTNDLRVRVNGSGTIQYYGHPTVEQGGLGSGKLIPLGEK